MILKAHATASERVIVGGGLTPLYRARGQARAYVNAETLVRHRFHHLGELLENHESQISGVRRMSLAAIPDPARTVATFSTLSLLGLRVVAFRPLSQNPLAIFCCPTEVHFHQACLVVRRHIRQY